MTKSGLVACLVALFCLSSGAIATADPGDSASVDRGPADAGILGLITNDDAFALADLSLVLATPLALGASNHTEHYGPFASGSTDSSTCGNDWADDTFDRHFTVRANGTGFTIVEQFKRGSFVTFAGNSPGACDESDGTPPGTVEAGITGNMHGYLVITLMGAQTSHDSSCIAGMPAAPCTGGGFIASHFTGPFTIGTFFFHYSAGDQGLVVHEWKNASADRGCNHGDIASANVGITPPFLASACP
jgi:hypothetical protein